MKKFLGVIAAAIILAAVGFAGYKYVLPRFTDGDSANSSSVYVMPVSNFNMDMMFVTNRYSGVIETQELVEVKSDSEKTISKTYVEAGDNVKKGDKLFEYDVEQIQVDLDQAKLDVEQAQTMVNSYNNQIASLEKEQRTATANQQLSLSNEIEALKLELKKANYEMDKKNKEIAKLERAVKNYIVTSPTDGKVQSVGGENATADGYIKIASNGDLRINAAVSEEHISEFAENDRILIRSRTDESLTWGGVVTSIDTSKPVNSANNMGTDAPTKYPVYIALDSTDGLMIGQHVTVELDFGFGQEEKEGLWIDEFYICDADTSPYVWCDNGNGELEKRTIQLGGHDDDMMQYQITSGLTETDLIAFPDDTLTEGMPTTTEFVFDEDDGAIIDENMTGGEDVTLTDEGTAGGVAISEDGVQKEEVVG